MAKINTGKSQQAKRLTNNGKEDALRGFSLQGECRPEFLQQEVLADIFRASASKFPKSKAIVGPDRELTYAEADAESDRIATELARRGAAPGTVVGLFFSRGINLLVSQIAITKTGATWLPFDSETPPSRIETCLADCNAIALLTDDDLAPRVAGLAQEIWRVSDRAFHNPLQGRFEPPAAHSPNHNAYLIYTSGSTGAPKGIAITHRNICHYLRACNAIFGITNQDIMFQGTSAAFDLSMEEIWVPYLVGACLWVATPEILADTEALPKHMQEAGVTVIDTVPTLLSMFAEDVPTLRAIIVGGEACPASLVNRFATATCRLFNSYGPTEATVVATIAELKKGDVVSIGRPIPNYTAYVVDENLQPTEPGKQGELLIGGPGIAAGYLGKPELTAQKFIANPFHSQSDDPILYRTGDAVAIDNSGNLLFQGRIDDQVKIRGFRVELGEIETAITQEDVAIEHCAVVLRNDNGLDRLVAFIAPRKDASPDLATLREALRKRLPPYMVPSAFEIIAEVPRLVSGKVDRKFLRSRPLSAAINEAEQSDPPENAFEEALISCAKHIFPGQAILREADFFTDLGGHSLLAAQFISRMRLHPLGTSITLQDMYAGRTIAKIAARLIERAALDQADKNANHPPLTRPSLRRRFWCGVAQGLSLPFILTLQAAPWLSIFIAYTLLSADENTMLGDMWIVFLAYSLVTLFNYIFVPVAKFLILRKTTPGTYPLYGTYYFRVWLVQRLTQLVHLKWMQGTPVLRFYLRLLGAQIGADVLISDISAGAVDLVSIGSHASIGGKVIIDNTRVHGGQFIIGPVHIGNDVVIGSSTVIENDVVIGDGAELSDLASLVAGTHVPAFESWSGSPARKVADLDSRDLPTPALASRSTRLAQTALYSVLLLLLPPIGILPIVPAFRLMEMVDGWIALYTNGLNSYWYYPVVAMPAAFTMVVFTALFIVALRWIVLPRALKPGVYSVYSSLYIRKWIVTLATEVMLDTLSSIFATIYMRTWYRLMGAKIGPGSEISTNLSGRYDLIDIGPGNFIADDVQLGDEAMRRNWMTLGSVKTGAKVFIGNEAVVPMNYVVESGALIGVKSRPPEGGEVGASETWFGSPPIKLPVRQTFAAAESATFRPKAWMLLGRALFEAFNISLPTALFITLATLGMELLNEPVLEGSWTEAIAMCILVVCMIDVAQVLIAALVKWVFMGVYRPTIKPMWSWWALRTEAVAVMYWGMAGKSIMEHLRGTPFLPWALRLFGVKIGKGVYLDAIDITEFDCVTIDDFAIVNALACLQTHLYEDRLMKVGRISIGKDVVVGAGSTVLYDTHVGDGAQIGPLTLVMKGEALPPSSSWVGSPAQPMRRSAANATAPMHQPAFAGA